jgi:hypothetical protein
MRSNTDRMPLQTRNSCLAESGNGRIIYLYITWFLLWQRMFIYFSSTLRQRGLFLLGVDHPLHTRIVRGRKSNICTFVCWEDIFLRGMLSKTTHFLKNLSRSSFEDIFVLPGAHSGGRSPPPLSCATAAVLAKFAK